MHCGNEAAEHSAALWFAVCCAHLQGCWCCCQQQHWCCGGSGAGSATNTVCCLWHLAPLRMVLVQACSLSLTWMLTCSLMLTRGCREEAAGKLSAHDMA